ncbi:DUF5711 family protein [Eubacterium oxidoreducens]|uniref:Uncharacterized protein n=1 Tax=Eubacterium oxidoreducens TaxID=1732 RepID=A0A1G6CS14_EUBOX|nr:DUF5711 family protein [Eubacterium oxidoreducens]SDB35657.1 hypothetical protein SAMN02910417_02631 [Eubacterium oxidoreducens]
MSDLNNRQQFRTVHTDIEEMNAMIAEHRKKILTRVIIIVAICVAALVTYELIIHLRTYDNYRVAKEVERQDSSGTVFEKMNGNILKYSHDGVSYTDLENNLIWNQTYELQNPQADICESYVVVYDKSGSDIYILNTEGLQSHLQSEQPIVAAYIAKQGTIAVLTVEDTTSQIELYDKDGNQLAKGEIHIEEGGYPVDIAISQDAQKLAVSTIDISDGSVKSTIMFYNFSDVGENETDHIVGTFSYAGTMIPRIEFPQNDELIAFGDNEIIIFKGSQKPEEDTTIKLKEEVKSILYNSSYFGIVQDYVAEEDDEEEVPAYQMVIYDLNGKQITKSGFDYSYSKIEFLENNEICMMGEKSCAIYTLKGKKKYEDTFDEELYKIYSGKTQRSYIFLISKKTQKVYLR